MYVIGVTYGEAMMIRIAATDVRSNCSDALNRSRLVVIGS